MMSRDAGYHSNFENRNPHWTLSFSSPTGSILEPEVSSMERVNYYHVRMTSSNYWEKLNTKVDDAIAGYRIAPKPEGANLKEHIRAKMNSKR